LIEENKLDKKRFLSGLLILSMKVLFRQFLAARKYD